jgi:hypothetical protein
MLSKLTIYRAAAIMLSVVVLLAACKKDKDIVPPALAHFANNTTGSFFVQNTPTSSYKIPIGVTTVSSTDRKVNVSVSSPTGATAGAQYTLPSTTVIIPAGETLDSLVINGIFAGFPGSRIDTLIFTITGGDVDPSEYNKTFKLVMQKYCDVTLANFTGNWIANDNDGTGDYAVTVAPVTAANQTSTTTGYIMVTGLWGVPASGPIRVNLDWTDPANFKTDIPTGQNLYVHATFGQAKVRPNGNGSFSSCNNTVELKYQVYVTAGNFAATRTTLRR